MEQVLEYADMAFKLIWPMIILAIPLVVGLGMRYLKSDHQKKMLAAAVDTAYLVVRQIARTTENKIDDKLEEALKLVNEEMGGKLKETDKEKAKRMLMAKHEDLKIQGKDD